MAKRLSLDQLLNDLGAVRNDPSAPSSREALLKALAPPSSVLVEKASSLIGELKLTGYAPEVAAAFERMMAAHDPGCAAKIAIAKALLETDTDDVAEPVYRRGLRYRQREGPTDVAGALRGYCALGLLNLRTRDALVELDDLFADPEPAARTAAVRGLASTGRDEAALLIRLRLLIGEPSPDVLTEALVALLRLDADRSLPFASRFLARPRRVAPPRGPRPAAPGLPARARRPDPQDDSYRRGLAPRAGGNRLADRGRRKRATLGVAGRASVPPRAPARKRTGGSSPRDRIRPRDPNASARTRRALERLAVARGQGTNADRTGRRVP